MGATLPSNQTDEIYRYPTSLMKSQSFSIDPFLVNMYKYREYNTDSPIYQLDLLISIMAESDDNGAMLRNILSMNGPSYACGRYWDWIEPYVKNKLSQ